jgi:hypothetical protein
MNEEEKRVSLRMDSHPSSETTQSAEDISKYRILLCAVSFPVDPNLLRYLNPVYLSMALEQGSATF